MLLSKLINEQMAAILNFWHLKLPYFVYNKWYWDLVFTRMFSFNYVKCWYENGRKKGKTNPKSCQGERHSDLFGCLGTIGCTLENIQLYCESNWKTRLNNTLSVNNRDWWIPCTIYTKWRSRPIWTTTDDCKIIQLYWNIFDA